MTSRRISILGVTGSIGQSTMSVIDTLKDAGWDIEVEAITAGQNVAALRDACLRLKPKFAALSSSDRFAEGRAALAGLDIEVGAGPKALEEAGARPADWVMSAIVGAAGLMPTMAAVQRGATVALANKECLVCSGPLFTEAARRFGAQLLPVDSEHNAIFQVLTHPARVEKVTLTASGGPFRQFSALAMAGATPEQACAHPRWSMGRKISVDSATMMNKGLELIEAAYLFDLAPEKLDVLVHPQSIVHSLVHYVDGSVLAQMASPDMRVPISYALAWPDRAATPAPRLDLAMVQTLSFEAPDVERFPALGLCRAALASGAVVTTTLSAANEVAVAAFLAGRIGFLDICRIVEEAVSAVDGPAGGSSVKSPSSLDEVIAVDRAARVLADRIALRLAAA
jgi:1-deoxy-D-xylulose-5-phosphate reductoisomerase